MHVFFVRRLREERQLVALASVLADGQRVYVPLIGEIPPAAAVGAGGGGTAAPSGPIDLNRASADELDALPGVGPATAQAMSQRGPHARVQDFAGVGHAPMLVKPDQRAVVRQFLLAA